MISVLPESEWQLVPAQSVMLLGSPGEQYSFACAVCHSQVNVSFAWAFANLPAPAEAFAPEEIAGFRRKYGGTFAAVPCSACGTVYLLRVKVTDRSYDDMCVTVEAIWKVSTRKVQER